MAFCIEIWRPQLFTSRRSGRLQVTSTRSSQFQWQPVSGPHAGTLDTKTHATPIKYFSIGCLGDQWCHWVNSLPRSRDSPAAVPFGTLARASGIAETAIKLKHLSGLKSWIPGPWEKPDRRKFRSYIKVILKLELHKKHPTDDPASILIHNDRHKICNSVYFGVLFLKHFECTILLQVH